MSMPNVPIFFSHQQVSEIPLKPLLWPLLYLLVSLPGLYDYIDWLSVNFLLGLPAIILCTQRKALHRLSFRYAIAAFCFALLNIFLPVKTFLYATVVCSICFSVEMYRGSINRLIPLVAVCMSAIFQYVAEVFSFPIRLMITKWAANIVSLAAYKVQSEGNILLLNGSEFSVDPACMGLNMLSASLLLGIMAIAVYEKKYAKKISRMNILMLLIGFILLNIFSNLLRIICLALFQIPAESTMHSFAGLLCLAVYGFAPSILIAHFVIKKNRRFATSLYDTNTSVATHKYCTYLLFTFLLLIGFSSLMIYANAGHISKTVGYNIQIPGYSAKALPNEVTKLQNNNELVYIKHIQGFYSTDHNPSICWRGSGYEFQQIQTAVIEGIEIYHAILQKGNETLYTAWWYDNGSNATISQLSWRWDEIHGGNKYSIVNITTASQKELLRCVAKALEKKSFNDAIIR